MERLTLDLESKAEPHVTQNDDLESETPVMEQRLFPQLPLAVEEIVIDLLPRNEVPCTVRLVNKASAEFYKNRQLTVVLLSEPVPNHYFAQMCHDELFKCYKRDVLELTAASGDVTNLEVALKAAGVVEPPPAYLVKAAAKAGQSRVCDWLHQRGCPWEQALSHAAKAGKQATCDWLLASGCPYDAAAAEAAALGGHLLLAEWLLEQRPADQPARPQWRLVAAVARVGSLGDLQRHYLAACPDHPPQAGGERGERDEVFKSAISSPTPDWAAKADWLAARGLRVWGELDVLTLPDAVDRLEWLRGHGSSRFSPFTLHTAARLGRIPVLEYLLGQQLYEREVCRPIQEELSYDGRLDVLRVLDAGGCWIDAPACMQRAQRGGHGELVAWLQENFAEQLKQ